MFSVDDLRIMGHSVDVSESGLLVDFEQALELWTNGELSLTVGDYLLSIGARVARAQDRSAGLSFFIEDDNDRLTVRIMIDFATSTPHTETVPPAVDGG